MNDKWKLIVRDDGPYDKKAERRKWRIVLADVLAFAVLLAGFAFFHHGMQRQTFEKCLVSCRSGALYMGYGSDQANDGGDAGYFTFEGRFTAQTPETMTDGTTTWYRDGGCEITLTTYQLASGPVRVADVYVSDIARLSTALANSAYGKGQRENVLPLTNRYGAVFSITGDNYSERYGGVIMRNGVLYSRSADPTRDLCVLNWDGVMSVYSPEEFNLTEAIDAGAYQIWSFGPALVREGAAQNTDGSEYYRPMRRSAIGYYQPGHYCFVLMEGSVSLADLAQTMVNLGCETAYNLYGGRLAAMTYNGTYYSTQQEVDRACSDVILITN